MTLNKADREELIKHRLEKADNLIPVIQFLIDQGHYLIAVNRIYYAMFYSLSALALHHGFDASKHLGLIGWFNKTFVKEAKVEKEIGKMLKTAFEMRSKGDYDDFVHYSKEEVNKLFTNMLIFLDNIKKLMIS